MRKTRFSTLSEINVTNLVDVTMVLLIIFMITAPLLRSGMKVNLPKTTSKDTNPRQGVVVTLSKDGQVFIDEDRVARDNFSTRLLKKYSARNDQQVLLQADREVPYGDVMHLMDEIKQVGIHNIGLIVEPVKKK